MLDDPGTVAPAPLLEVAGLQKTDSSTGLFGPRRRVTAAESVSFQLRRGEAVALVGASGSGRSAGARLLLRLERPDGGQIRENGQDVQAQEPLRASLGLRARVQSAFQAPYSAPNSAHALATDGRHTCDPEPRLVGKRRLRCHLYPTDVGQGALNA